jgi:hypothetical protein
VGGGRLGLQRAMMVVVMVIIISINNIVVM